MLYLPDVTLINVDTTNPDRGRRTMERIAKLPILFGAAKLLTSRELPLVTDYETYNRFMVCDAWKHFDTSHALFVQDDGFPINASAWSDGFLLHDYIGAPWYDYGPGRAINVRENGTVGNGGFSLRSRRFCHFASVVVREFIAKHPGVPYAPEDQLLCNGPGWGGATHYPEIREELESLGMQYAPVDVAARFSWELHDNDPVYRGQFGFHGKHTMERLNIKPV